MVNSGTGPVTGPVSTPRQLASLEGVKVLLIEDTWIIASAMKSMVELLGAVVIGPVASVAEAGKAAEVEAVDVALVDLNLKGEMAYDVIRRLKDRSVPVIIVTGYEVPPELMDDAAVVLKKPIRAEDLLANLRRLAAEART